MILEWLIFFCVDTHFFIGLENEVHTKGKRIGGLYIGLSAFEVIRCTAKV